MNVVRLALANPVARVTSTQDTAVQGARVTICKYWACKIAPFCA